jgi:hypothetical protein
MVLAKDITNQEGRVLCGKGTALTDTLIERLKKMEITHLAVMGHPVEVEGEKTLEEELQEIERRFSRVLDTPPLMYLKKRLTEQLIHARRK